MMEKLQQPAARWWVRGILVGALTLFGACAWAQSGGGRDNAPSAPKPAAPPPSDLEPGVNTSAPQTSSPAPVPAPGGSSPTPAEAPTPVPGKARTTAAPKSGAAAGKAHDRLELDTTQITGNRELPKVLYIVPWKRSDLGDLVGKPVNSLLDEVLTPVDRDVFKRQNRYYDALKPDAAKDPAGVAAEANEKH